MDMKVFKVEDNHREQMGDALGLSEERGRQLQELAFQTVEVEQDLVAAGELVSPYCNNPNELYFVAVAMTCRWMAKHALGSVIVIPITPPQPPTDGSRTS